MLKISLRILVHCRTSGWENFVHRTLPQTDDQADQISVKNLLTIGIRCQTSHWENFVQYLRSISSLSSKAELVSLENLLTDSGMISDNGLREFRH